MLSKYIHGIAVVSRADLLLLAVNSIKPFWESSFIVDNSPDGAIGREHDWPIPVTRPSVPLSCSQTLNFLHRLAKDQGATAFGFQHGDAEACPGSADRYIATLQELQSSTRRWAAMMTAYDILGAYDVAAVNEVGPWDTAFPQPNYHFDVDWFHRVRLLDFEIVESGIPVIHHDGGSQTLRHSPFREMVNSITFPMNEVYYRKKWGGGAGHEVYCKPWNGVPSA